MDIPVIFIYPKDIQYLRGYKTYVSAFKLYHRILDHYKKTKEQGLLITEFCDFVGSDERTISRLLNNPDKKKK